MQLKDDILDRLEELDGNYIPREAGGRTDYGEARGLLWVLEIEHGSIMDGDCLDLSEFIEQ